MKFLYSGHLGGLYVSDKHIESTYCKTCGDYDWKIGEFNTIEQFWELVKDDNWVLQYVYPLMIEMFDLPDDAKYNDTLCRREEGFCCNTDEEILGRIKELIEAERKTSNA